MSRIENRSEKIRTDLVFLEIAQKDLEAAKYMFDRKLYSHAVFWLQQSIEKAIKSFGVWNGIITETEARKVIGHRAWKVYFKIFNEFMDKVVKLKEGLMMFPKLQQVSLIKDLKLSELKNEFDKYQRAFSSKDIAWNISFSVKELNNIVSYINNLKNELRGEIAIRIDEKEIEDFKQKLYGLLDILSEVSPFNVEEAKKELNGKITSQLISDLLKKLLKLISKLILCCFSLFRLSLIFSPHAVKPRYPQDNFNPLDVYNERMPLVQMFNSFMKIVKESLKNLNYIYTEMCFVA